MTATRFYVERPADEYGNTSMAKAVVEARVDGRRMIPVAPEYHVRGWPSGWLTDIFGGWMETAGPARMLTDSEWESLTGCRRK